MRHHHLQKIIYETAASWKNAERRPTTTLILGIQKAICERFTFSWLKTVTINQYLHMQKKILNYGLPLFFLRNISSNFFTKVWYFATLICSIAADVGYFTISKCDYLLVHMDCWNICMGVNEFFYIDLSRTLLQCMYLFSYMQSIG